MKLSIIIKKILKISLIVLLLLFILAIILHFISALLLAKNIKHKLDEQLHVITSSKFITVENYGSHYGILHGSQDFDLIVNPIIQDKVNKALKLRSKYKIHCHTDITFGIFSGLLHGVLAPTMLYSDTQLTFSSDISATLKYFFEEKTPLKIENVIYINGNGVLKITSPKFNYQESISRLVINWGGVAFITNYNNDLNRFNTDINLPLIYVNIPSMIEILINNWKYNSSHSIDEIKTGTDDININQIKVLFRQPLATIVNFNTVIHLIFALNINTFVQNITALNNDFEIDKIKYHSVNSITNGFFNSKSITEFSNLTIMHNTYGPFYLAFNLDHILAKNFIKLSTNLDRLLTNNSADAMNELEKSLIPILKDKPEFGIQALKICTPSGNVFLSTQFIGNHAYTSDIMDYDKFLKNFLINIKFSLPQPVIKYLLFLEIKDLLNAGNEKIDIDSITAMNQLLDNILNQQISRWTKMGYIKQESDIISANIHIVNGKIQVNKQ